MELNSKGVITIRDVESVVKSFQELLTDNIMAVKKRDGSNSTAVNPALTAENCRRDSSFRTIVIDTFIEIVEAFFSGQINRTSIMGEINQNIDLLIDICEMVPPYTQEDVVKVEKLFQLWKFVEVHLEPNDRNSLDTSQDNIKKKKRRNKKKKNENVESSSVVAQSVSIESARTAANKLIDKVIGGIKQFLEVKVFLNEYSLKEPLRMSSQNELIQIANEVLESDSLGIASEEKVAELRKLMKEFHGDSGEVEKVKAEAATKEGKAAERVRRNPRTSDSRDRRVLNSKPKPVTDAFVGRPSLSGMYEQDMDIRFGNYLGDSQHEKQDIVEMPSVSVTQLSEERKRRIEQKEKEVERLKCLSIFLKRYSLQCEMASKREVASSAASTV